MEDREPLEVPEDNPVMRTNNQDSTHNIECFNET